MFKRLFLFSYEVIEMLKLCEELVNMGGVWFLIILVEKLMSF